MRIANWRAWLFVLAVSGPAAALAAPTEADPRMRDVEANLLHKRLDLGSIAEWRHSAGAWLPLSVPPARVYVVNLWSVHCAPCIAEMPLFAKLVRGWSGDDESVRFLFVSDPPSDTSVAELERFWSKPPVELPASAPCRTTNERLRDGLGVGMQPLTLLLDEHFIVRQVFAGALGTRALGAAIERLLAAVKVSEQSEGRRRDKRR